MNDLDQVPFFGSVLDIVLKATKWLLKKLSEFHEATKATPKLQESPLKRKGVLKTLRRWRIALSDRYSITFETVVQHSRR